MSSRPGYHMATYDPVTKQKYSMSNNEHMLFLFSDLSGAIIMMNLGVIFYTEKLLKSSLFMDS